MSEPLISIIVTSYCPESIHFLELCVRSIANLSYKNIETIIVARPDYMPEFPNCRTISPPEQSFWNGRGINFGCENSKGEYFFIVNDDCVLTRDCVQPLLSWASRNVNVMPMSNDSQGRYYDSRSSSFFKLSKDEPNDLINFDHWPVYDGHTPEPPLIFADTLCLYAHMVSRKLWERVGPMDDSAGLIDIDWCLRVRNAGYFNAIELSSLVWHFGGSSVMHTLDDSKRTRQREQFKRKWGWVP